MGVCLWVAGGALGAWAAEQPPNDYCTNAIVIPADQGFPQFAPIIWDVSGATTNGDPIMEEFECSLARIPINSVWYRFRPGADGTYVFSTAGSTATFTNLDTVVAVYEAPGGCDGPLILVNCNNDVEADFRAAMFAPLSAGTDYLVFVALFYVYTGEDGTNTLQLEVDSVAPPANDTCATAWLVPTNAALPYLTPVMDIAAADNGSPVLLPECVYEGCQTLRSVWVEFRPAVTAEYALSLCSELTDTAVYDTLMAVYAAPDGCGGTLTPVACNDDDETCTCEYQSWQSHIETVLTNGMRYYIVIWQVRAVEDAVDELLPGNSCVQLAIYDPNRFAVELDSMGSGFYRLRFAGIPSRLYQVEGSHDLRQWTYLGDPTWFADQRRFILDYMAAGDPHQFFRVRRL
ncbi:MAG: hypothetical protein JXQ71_13515 [Verrucomicrobia bacterium]|nr:hypothetical protein [Verrucomicrobiota bacterium]